MKNSYFPSKQRLLWSWGLLGGAGEHVGAEGSPSAVFLLYYLIRIDYELGEKYYLRTKRLHFHLILRRHRYFQVQKIQNQREGW